MKHPCRELQLEIWVWNITVSHLFGTDLGIMKINMVVEVVGVDRNLQEVIILSQKRLSIHSEKSSITIQAREEQTLKEYTVNN